MVKLLPRIGSILFLLFSSFYFVSSALVDGVIQTGITIPKGDENERWARQDYTLPTDQFNSVTFIIFPCFGEFTWYIGKRMTPTETNYTEKIDFIPRRKEISWTASEINEPAFFVLRQQANENFDEDISGQMDVVATTDEATWRTNNIPEPGGRLIAELIPGDDSDSVTISWTPTDNPDDTYSVWKTPEEGNAEDGYNAFSACGIKYFMTLQEVDIIDEDGLKKTTITDIEKDTDFQYAVLVERPGAYMSSYGTVQTSISSITQINFLSITLSSLIFFLFCK